LNHLSIEANYLDISLDLDYALEKIKEFHS